MKLISAIFPICQRYFNVRNYNPQAKNSLDLYYTISEIADDLQHSLKNKAFHYMYDRYNQYTNYVNLSDQDLEKNKDEVKRRATEFTTKINKSNPERQREYNKRYYEKKKKNNIQNYVNQDNG